MEYIEGRTLDELIGPKGMPPAQALKLAVQIADGVAMAHAAGILHRDLKPSNVIVTADGRVKILDFGLAKLLDPETSPEATTVTIRDLTEQGEVMGTVAYMSPEQAEGRKLDGRSDIFSFGSVLFQMVTGRKPFTGDSTFSVVAKILKEEPTPPSRLATSIPPELERIILRCLRKGPGAALPSYGGPERGASGREGGIEIGQTSVAVSITPPLGMDMGGAVPGSSLLGFRLAGVTRPRRRAAPGRSAYHATGSASISLVFSRRQSRSFQLDRAKTEQSGHLCPANRRRFCHPSDNGPGQ